jgi:hypothetical protein
MQTNNKANFLKSALVLISFLRVVDDLCLALIINKMVEVTGLEPATYCLQSSRSPS